MRFNRVLFIIIFVFAFSKSFGQLKEFYIECNPDDFQMIYDKYKEDIYIPITFSYDGKTWTDCEMRIRGETSRYSPKKSLKIKFRGEPFVNGRSTLNINAEYQDKSYLHNVLASRVYSAAGMNCYTSEPVRINLNGKYLGLYIIIENMDDEFIESRNLSKGGNLYKATSDGSCLSIFDDFRKTWEKKTNKNGDWSDIELLRDGINSVPDSLFGNFIDENFDYNNVITVIALNMLLANGSTYYHNYYLFHDIGGSGKWMIFPWDMDKTFNTYGYGWHYAWNGAWIFPDNPILKRSLLDEKMFADIQKRLDELSDTVFNEDYLFPIIDSLENLIRESVLEDKTDDIEDDLADFDKWVNGMKEFIRHRKNVIDDQINRCPLPFKMCKMDKIYTGDIPITWNKTFCLSGEEVDYNIIYSTNPWKSEEFNVIENISDTSYILKNLPNGTYYLKVVAMNGNYTQTATDKYNKFVIKEGIELPCNIEEDMTLTEEGSPYIANCSVVIQPGVKLTVLEGVEIRINGFYNFEVRGEIEAVGTDEKPVIFRPDVGVSKFREFYMKEPTDECSFENVEFYNCNIKAYDGNYTFNKIKVFIDDSSILDDAIYAERAIFRITNSRIEAQDISEGVIIFYSNQPIIDNCIAIHTADAYQFVVCEDGIITNNIAIEPSDEGIDHNGCNNTLIKGNIIINPGDKCISIGHDGWGSCKNINVMNNILVGSQKSGFELKSGSEIYLQNNTIINNQNGIHEYRKIANTNVVKVEAVNNIFYNNTQDIFLEDSSELSLRYSISNTSKLEGEYNLFGDPLFADYEHGDYHLTENSPCIDSGDPNVEKDPDGTRSDIGAFYYNQNIPRIVINEINYHSSDEYNSGDWVEIYNDDYTDVDLSNWTFKDSDDSHTFIFPEGTVLKKGEYLVLFNDYNKFENIFPDVSNKIGVMDFGFSSSGELIRLYDNYGKLIDFVEYSDKNPWDERADGEGFSLELINPKLDNNLAESWKASKNHGTPGEKNTNFFVDTSEDDNNAKFEIENLFPNPAKNYIVLETSGRDIELIKAYDMNGREIYLKWDYLSKSRDSNYYYLNTSFLLDGFYYLSLKAGNRYLNTGFVIIR